jgi:tripeptide aminopeptidase
MNRQRLLERFLSYVRVDTTADAGATSYPSSTGQRELGRMLLAELREMGLSDAAQDEHAIVVATLPARAAHDVPVIALSAHLDTSPETRGTGVRPQVIRSYRGGDLVLPADASQIIRVADNPELLGLAGRTLITTDGTTLLGADDKAGVAVIMETAAYLLEHPRISHGSLRLLFTCDEEIGRGVDHVDIDRLGAVACYTLDGPGSGQIDVETFSADLATISFRGQNIHPSIAKDQMVNSIRAAAALVSRLPRDHLAPEATADREGFVHAYSLQAAVGQSQLQILLRDFATEKLAGQAALLQQLVADVRREFPGCAIDVDIQPQYRNLGDGLTKEPRAIAFVEEAYRRLGRRVQQSSIRGGTDGSRLTELGLPTPNLSTGQHNPHSTLEWACLEEMEAAVEVLVALVQVWAEQSVR